MATPISVDTRKAAVAGAALDAGASMVNDVSGLDHDPRMAALVAARGAPLCIMHSAGPPETMQDDPRYGDVVLDVFDALAARIETAEAAGIPRARLIVDPGLGFGKTLDHNLALLARISLFHSLGCPVLAGASRKGFIGRIGGAPSGPARAPGSIAGALALAAQGVQVLRVHDTSATKQALRLWRAATEGTWSESEGGDSP